MPACLSFFFDLTYVACVHVLAGMESLVSEATTAVTGLPTVQDAMAVRRELDELLQVSASFTTRSPATMETMVFGLVNLIRYLLSHCQNLWDSDEEGLSSCGALKESDNSFQRKNFHAVPSILLACVPLNFWTVFFFGGEHLNF
jgi:hypothetical protein